VGLVDPGGARLVIDKDGRITAFTGKVDGGQGNRVALTRIIAAELAASTSMIRLEMGDTACAPFDLGTFGSRSMPDAGHALRLIAVAGRRELLREAAQKWQCDPDDLLLARGAVCDRSGGREIAYGALVGGGSRTIRVDPDDSLSPAPPGLEGRRQLKSARCPDRRDDGGENCFRPTCCSPACCTVGCYDHLATGGAEHS